MQATDERDSRLLWGWVIGLALFSALYRAFPYYFLDAEGRMLWNLAPIGALALFAGTRLRSRWAFLVPVAAMFVSDLLLIKPLEDKGGAFGLDRPLIYGCFVLYVLMGRLLSRKESSPLVLGGAALLGGAPFFVLSNFAVWLGGTYYPHTRAGLGQCYALAIPFYRNTLAGDLLFTLAFFGLYAVIERAAELGKVRQPA